MDDSSPKRRRLTYEYDIDVAQIEKMPGESLADILRPAARHWAFAHGEVIRGFSTQRAGCCAQQGKVFRFEVEGGGNSISLRAGQAGHCHGEARKTRELSTHSQASFTVDDRRRIQAAADSLLEDGLSVTPRGVILRMGSPPVDSKHVTCILAWCRKKLGKSTVVLDSTAVSWKGFSVFVAETGHPRFHPVPSTST